MLETNNVAFAALFDVELIRIDWVQPELSNSKFIDTIEVKIDIKALGGITVPESLELEIYWDYADSLDLHTSPSNRTFSIVGELGEEIYEFELESLGDRPLGGRFIQVEFAGVDAITDVNNNAVHVEVPPQVVNVVTHGFLGNILGIDAFYAIKEGLDTLPTEGSALDQSVDTYVHQWDSSTGWLKAFGGAIAFSLAPLPLKFIPAYAIDLAMRTARAEAENAAADIVEEIINNTKYLVDPNLKQVIHLIGHSRGAAVNARVSEILNERGYTVNEYTALDGYSTDWPEPSGRIGDIEIVGVATAENLVNYRVEASLATIPLTWLPASIVSLFSFETLNEFFGDWRAPERAGFDNWVLEGPVGNPSHHLNISQLYFTEDYYADNYLGDERYSLPNEEIQPIVVGLSNEPSIAATLRDESEFQDFYDGQFNELGQFMVDLTELEGNETVHPEFASWIQSINTPEGLLGLAWKTEGNVSLVSENQNAMAKLTGSQSSLSQLIFLGQTASEFSFDLSSESVQAGDTLEVFVGNSVLEDIHLTVGTSSQSISISLAGYENQSEHIGVRLVGSTDAVVRIDNVAISSPSFADFNNDGTVNGRDFLSWQRGQSPNPFSSNDLAVWQAEYSTDSGLNSIGSNLNSSSLITSRTDNDPFDETSSLGLGVWITFPQTAQQSLVSSQVDKNDDLIFIETDSSPSLPNSWLIHSNSLLTEFEEESAMFEHTDELDEIFAEWDALGTLLI